MKLEIITMLNDKLERSNVDSFEFRRNHVVTWINVVYKDGTSEHIDDLIATVKCKED